MERDYQGATAVRFDYEYDTSFPDKVKSVTPKNPTTSVFEPNWQGWRYDYHPVGSPAPGSLQRVYRIRNDGTTLDTMTTYTYDNKGWVISTSDAAGSATDYTYDAQGNFWKVTAPSNNDAGIRPVTTYAYDNLGRLMSATDPLGKIRGKRRVRPLVLAFGPLVLAFGRCSSGVERSVASAKQDGSAGDQLCRQHTSA